MYPGISWENPKLSQCQSVSIVVEWTLLFSFVLFTVRWPYIPFRLCLCAPAYRSKVNLWLHAVQTLICEISTFINNKYKGDNLLTNNQQNYRTELAELLSTSIKLVVSIKIININIYFEKWLNYGIVIWVGKLKSFVLVIKHNVIFHPNIIAYTLFLRLHGPHFMISGA